MFERFTERARQVIVLAQEEARGLMHPYIGTEHILLGLLREGEGLAVRVLESLGLTADGVRAKIVEVAGTGDETTAGQIPFTPRAKSALQRAQTEAHSLGHSYMGTEHLLLGLVRENEGMAMTVLLAADIDADNVRDTVLRMLSDPKSVPESASTRFQRGFSDWLARAGALAQDGGRGHPDSGDFLLALFEQPDFIVAATFASFDVDAERLRQAIERSRERDQDSPGS